MSSYKVELKEYLITVQHLLCLAIKDNLIFNNRFKTFSNNLNDKDVNGTTHFDLAVHVRLLANLCKTTRSEGVLF